MFKMPRSNRQEKVQPDSAGSIMPHFKNQPRMKDHSQTETLCYHPNAKVVSIVALRDVNSSAGNEKDLRGLWDSQIERTIAVGPLHIYRPPASIAFLSCGAALQPLFPKSQCWCIDKSGRHYILQIRPPHYWRIELGGSDSTNQGLAMSFRESIGRVLQLEKTSYPFHSTRSSGTLRSYPSAPNLTTALTTGDPTSMDSGLNGNSEDADSTTRMVPGSRAQQRRSLPPISGISPELLLSQQPLPVVPSPDDEMLLLKQQPNTSCKRQPLIPTSQMTVQDDKPINKPTSTQMPLASVEWANKTAAKPLAEISTVHVAGYIQPGTLEALNEPTTASSASSAQTSGNCATTALEKGTERAKFLSKRPDRLSKQATNDTGSATRLDPATSCKSEQGLASDEYLPIQSLAAAISEWPRRLVTVLLRIVKTFTSLIWAADPAVCTAATTVYDWDSEGDLSGFSDDELVVSDQQSRLATEGWW